MHLSTHARWHYQSCTAAVIQVAKRAHFEGWLKFKLVKLCLMLKILYASCPGLSVVISAQFAVRMCVAVQNHQKIKPLFWHLMSLKDIDFGANRKPVYDFLLVINSNLGFILHLFWNMATYWLKIIPSLIYCTRSGWSLQNLWKSFTDPETRNSGSKRWKFGDPSLHLFWLIHPCDGWMNEQTDRWTDRTAIAKTRCSSTCSRT